MCDKYELEKMFEVWPKHGGYHCEVGLDRDGLGLVEIRLFQGKEIVSRMSFHYREAQLIARALEEIANDLESEEMPF